MFCVIFYFIFLKEEIFIILVLDLNKDDKILIVEKQYVKWRRVDKGFILETLIWKEVMD